MSQLKQAISKQNGRIPPSSTFCSIQALTGLEDAHPRWGGQSAEPTVSDADLIWNHSHRHSPKYCLTFVQSSRHIKLTNAPSFPKTSFYSSDVYSLMFFDGGNYVLHITAPTPLNYFEY